MNYASRVRFWGSIVNDGQGLSMSLLGNSELAGYERFWCIDLC